MSQSAYYEKAEVLLSAKDVNLELGGRQILRDVNFEIRDLKRPGMTQGQIVGLLGPSGMGKTQLFRILSGLNLPDSGQVLVGAEQVPVRAGMVGVVAQNYPLFRHRTVLANLIVAGKQARELDGEITERAKKLLERFGLADHGDKYPIQLSGGQRQRVAIAQQFMCSENFLLMDEPFSGLDPLALDSLCDFITEIGSSNELKTFILVTHDIAASIRVCDSLWLLGRDRDASGKPIAGARIQHTINLIDEGLAWRKGIDSTPEFFKKVSEVRNLFSTL